MDPSLVPPVPPDMAQAAPIGQKQQPNLDAILQQLAMAQIGYIIFN